MDFPSNCSLFVDYYDIFPMQILELNFRETIKSTSREAANIKEVKILFGFCLQMETVRLIQLVDSCWSASPSSSETTP